MSSGVGAAWDAGVASGIDSARCKTSTLCQYLEEQELLGGSPPDRDAGDYMAELTTRDADRARIVKRLSAAPEGLMVRTLVSEVVKGQRVSECERFDGSDADYQFVYRFVTALEENDPALVDCETVDGLKRVVPTIGLLDLISEGITQTNSQSDAQLYDRQFAELLLQRAGEVSSRGRETLESSLQRYIDRIEDYRLLFDVQMVGRRGGATTERMTKDYKTRFNSQGRIRKQWARFNQSLEHAYDRYDNAVLMTLTTDPGTTDDPDRPDPRSLWEMIRGPNGDDGISHNFNRLLSFMDSDPSTIADSRGEFTAEYPHATGRPRKRPPYLKALEFSEKGYPHLHVLMFDVPTRHDGMPYLIDKQELSDKWSDYGQGQIVDLYPLTFRDDLDELEGQPFGTKTVPLEDDDGETEQVEMPIQEGFVDWYRYGSHDLDDDEIAARARSHDLIEFHVSEDDDSQESMQQKTAGSYLGKYLSATFGALLDAGEESYDGDGYADKISTWKLGMYWATNKRFWSVSRDIQKGIERHDHMQDPNVRDAVREFTVDAIASTARPALLDELARRQWSDLDALRDAVDDSLDELIRPGVESTLPESSDFLCLIDFLGTYAYWDMPPESATGQSLEAVEDAAVSLSGPEDPEMSGDRPPPLAQVWG
jgi:hypothetical protein